MSGTITHLVGELLMTWTIAGKIPWEFLREGGVKKENGTFSSTRSFRAKYAKKLWIELFRARAFGRGFDPGHEHHGGEPHVEHEPGDKHANQRHQRREGSP